jgi:hypothetical protein
MNAKLIYILTLILVGFSSYAQKKENNDSSLITKVTGRKSLSTYTIYKSKNWNNEFVPMPKNYFETEFSRIDIEALKKIVREEISPKYYDQLNKILWTITTKLTGDGQIISVKFSFRNDSIPDIEEFRKMEERIKKEVRWNLKFNKEVTDYFNLQLTIQGPKL